MFKLPESISIYLKLFLFLSIPICFYISESILLFIWIYFQLQSNRLLIDIRTTKKPKSDQHKISSGTTSDLHQTQIRPSSAKHKFNIRPTKDQYQTTSDKNQSNLYLTNISKNLKIIGIIKYLTRLISIVSKPIWFVVRLYL